MFKVITQELSCKVILILIIKVSKVEIIPKNRSLHFSVGLGNV